MASLSTKTVTVFLALSAQHRIGERKYTGRLSVWVKTSSKWMKASVILQQSLPQPKTAG